MSEYSESDGYDYLVSPVTYVSFVKQSDGTEVEFDDSANPVKLVLYIKTYDASKTYKPMKYDTDTDTLAIDDTLTILNQDES